MMQLTNKSSSIFPTELQSKLAQFCHARELAALSQIHSGWRHEAERELYRGISLIIYDDATGDSGLLQSLHDCREGKAELVHSLFLYFGPESSGKAPRHHYRRRLGQVCALLPAMVNLQYLGIHIHRDGALTPSRLTKALSACTFELAGLLCVSSVNLSSLIAKHGRNLQIFGYRWNTVIDEEHIVSRFHSCGPGRVSFGVRRDGSLNLDAITLYPAFEASGKPMLWSLETHILPLFDRFETRQSEFNVNDLNFLEMVFRDLDQMSLALGQAGETPRAGAGFQLLGVMELDIRLIQDTLFLHTKYPSMAPLLTCLPGLERIVIWPLERLSQTKPLLFDTESPAYDTSPRILWYRDDLVREAVELCPRLKSVCFSLAEGRLNVDLAESFAA